MPCLAGRDYWRVPLDVAWTFEADDGYWVELAGEIELSDMNREGVLDDFYKVLDAILVTYNNRNNGYNAATRVFDGERPIGEWATGWQHVSVGQSKE